MWFIKFVPSKLLSIQARKPSGLIGRFLMTKMFNDGNADLNAFVKENLRLQVDDRVLEIGFGPGKMINEIAGITTQGIVEGIDFSETMVKQASRVNSMYISSGRVNLHKGECSCLPFENESFDKICSSNTIYFWKNPKIYFSEMFRVMKPGGIIVIGFRDDIQMSKLNLSSDVFSLFSKKDVSELLLEAGFENALVLEKNGVPFDSYCCVASKP